MRFDRFLIAVGASALLFACGGALDAPETSPASKNGQGPTTSTGPSGPTSPPESTPEQSAPPPGETDAPPKSSSTTIPPGKDLPSSGACADRETGPGKIGSAAPGIKCTVHNATKDKTTAFVSIDTVTGDRGDAALSSGTLLLRCASADAMLFEAAIRCFAGSGQYTIAPGDVVLGEDSSDRACTIDVDLDTSAVRGFIQCPNDPQDPDNVFASSGPPIGLGHFDLGRTF